MVLITEELVRKKSEHNELMISTLEEISLHQEDIEKIEHIHNWCRDLKILLMQNNLISKIENLFKLKKLEYLNLAINCIEVIENLEKCESLNKLDLTLNFIAELSSVRNLSGNYNLRHLTLTGNPCVDFKGYRDFVLAVLPQLDTLDGIEVKASDKIFAKTQYEKNRKKLVQFEANYLIKRDEQKIRVANDRAELEAKIVAAETDEERNKLFWNTQSEHCPETRRDISAQHRKGRGLDEKPKAKPKKDVKFFAPCGRPYCMNQPKLKFHLSDEPDRYELDLHVYKYLDTSLIELDVQPNYVRVKVKDKYFQLALAKEVSCSEAISKRSTITGKLLVIMPKLEVDKSLILKVNPSKKVADLKINSTDQAKDLSGAVDYKNIVNDDESKKTKNQESINEKLPDLI